MEVVKSSLHCKGSLEYKNWLVSRYDFDHYCQVKFENDWICKILQFFSQSLTFLRMHFIDLWVTRILWLYSSKQKITLIHWTKSTEILQSVVSIILLLMHTILLGWRTQNHKIRTRKECLWLWMSCMPYPCNKLKDTLE